MTSRDPINDILQTLNLNLIIPLTRLTHSLPPRNPSGEVFSRTPTKLLSRTLLDYFEFKHKISIEIDQKLPAMRRRPRQQPRLAIFPLILLLF